MKFTKGCWTYLKENEPRKMWLKELEKRQTQLQTCKNADYELYLYALLALTM